MLEIQNLHQRKFQNFWISNEVNWLSIRCIIPDLDQFDIDVSSQRVLPQRPPKNKQRLQLEKLGATPLLTILLTAETVEPVFYKIQIISPHIQHYSTQFANINP